MGIKQILLKQESKFQVQGNIICQVYGIVIDQLKDKNDFFFPIMILKIRGKFVSNIINLTIFITPLNIRILLLEILNFCLTPLNLKLFFIHLRKALVILLRIFHHFVYFILPILNMIFLNLKIKVISVKICFMFHIKRRFVSRVFIVC